MRILSTLLLTLLFINGFIYAEPEIEWYQNFGGAGLDSMEAIFQDSDDNYIMGGYTYSTDEGTSDGWVIKLEDDGTEDWEKTFGDDGNDGFYHIAPTSDGGIICCGWYYNADTETSDAWVVKLNSKGTRSWQTILGDDSTEWARHIAETPDDGFIITGTVMSADGEADVYLAKLDENGDLEWEETYGSDETDSGAAVIALYSGDYVLAANTEAEDDGDLWLIKLDENGTQEWDKIIGGDDKDFVYDMQLALDNGYLITGYTSSFGEGMTDIWVMKLSKSGEQEWAQSFGTSGYDASQSFGFCSDAGYIIAGSTDNGGEDDRDMYVLKLDYDGTLEWDDTYGGPDHEWITSIIETDDGGYILGGLTYSFGEGNGDAWVIKLEN